MEEVYTCKCGNQSWVIYSGKIECNKCGIVHWIKMPFPANEFNNQLEKEK